MDAHKNFPLHLKIIQLSFEVDRITISDDKQMKITICF